mmetsp:Transcript_8031/g.31666  ORF Transcript_8031/g.31666 Transcript_8031/m.31666 type:complete len:934 (+) Transcript_8031:1656-4457(+)
MARVDQLELHGVEAQRHRVGTQPLREAVPRRPAAHVRVELRHGMQLERGHDREQQHQPECKHGDGREPRHGRLLEHAERDLRRRRQPKGDGRSDPAAARPVRALAQEPQAEHAPRAQLLHVELVKHGKGLVVALRQSHPRVEPDRVLGHDRLRARVGGRGRRHGPASPSPHTFAPIRRGPPISARLLAAGKRAACLASLGRVLGLGRLPAAAAPGPLPGRAPGEGGVERVAQQNLLVPGGLHLAGEEAVVVGDPVELLLVPDGEPKLHKPRDERDDRREDEKHGADVEPHVARLGLQHAPHGLNKADGREDGEREGLGRDGGQLWREGREHGEARLCPLALVQHRVVVDGGGQDGVVEEHCRLRDAVDEAQEDARDGGAFPSEDEERGRDRAHQVEEQPRLARAEERGEEAPHRDEQDHGQHERKQGHAEPDVVAGAEEGGREPEDGAAAPGAGGHRRGLHHVVDVELHRRSHEREGHHVEHGGGDEGDEGGVAERLLEGGHNGLVADGQVGQVRVRGAGGAGEGAAVGEALAAACRPRLWAGRRGACGLGGSGRGALCRRHGARLREAFAVRGAVPLWRRGLVGPPRVEDAALHSRLRHKEHDQPHGDQVPGGKGPAEVAEGLAGALDVADALAAGATVVVLAAGHAKDGGVCAWQLVGALRAVGGVAGVLPEHPAQGHGGQRRDEDAEAVDAARGHEDALPRAGVGRHGWHHRRERDGAQRVAEVEEGLHAAEPGGPGDAVVRELDGGPEEHHHGGVVQERADQHEGLAPHAWAPAQTQEPAVREPGHARVGDGVRGPRDGDEQGHEGDGRAQAGVEGQQVDVQQHGQRGHAQLREREEQDPAARNVVSLLWRGLGDGEGAALGRRRDCCEATVCRRQLLVRAHPVERRPARLARSALGRRRRGGGQSCRPPAPGAFPGVRHSDHVVKPRV